MERERCPGIAYRLEGCGRFLTVRAPSRDRLGSLGATIRAVQLCDRCTRREALADKRRRVLARNIARRHGA